MNDDKKANMKKHVICISLLLILVLAGYSRWLDSTTLPMLDHTTAYLVRVQMLETSIERYNDFMPLWNPYLMSGVPLFAQAIFMGSDYLMGILVTLFTAIVAIKIQYLLNIFLAGLFMYIFIYYMTKKHNAAFLTALIYMFGGYTVRYFMVGALTTMNTFPFMPLAFLFLMKALKEKGFHNAVILGAIMGIMFRAGPDMKVMAWLAPGMALYGIFYLLGNDAKQRLKKLAVVGLIVGIIFLGLSAQRVLPTQEHVARTSRAALTFEESASRPLLMKDMFTRFVQPLKTFKDPRAFGVGEYIGIIAFLFVLYGVYKTYASKNTIFFIMLFILGVLLATGSFVYYFLWKYIPPYASFRYVERSLIVCFFALTILAGIGINSFFNSLEKKAFSKKKMLMATGAVAALLLLNLALFGYSPYDESALRNVDKLIKENHVTNYLKQQPGHFRFQVWETKGIDWGTEFYNLPYELELTYGYDVAWIQEYFNEYLGIALRQPAKLWGILNVKYLTSTEPLNIEGFELEKELPACDYCPVDPLLKGHGKYIYKNSLFLPRAYASDAILVVGNEDAQKQVIYSLLLHQDFNTSRYFFVSGKERINDHSIEELERYGAIFLTSGSFDQGISLLESYKKQGGIILPDILEGKNGIDENELKQFLMALGKPLAKMPEDSYIRKDFDHYTLDLGKKYDGWIVLSERFAYFPGWKAYADGKEIPLYKANGVIAALYLGAPYDKIEFEYLPKSFVAGTWITSITIILLIAYFAYSFVKNRKGMKHEA